MSAIAAQCQLTLHARTASTSTLWLLQNRHLVPEAAVSSGDTVEASKGVALGIDGDYGGGRHGVGNRCAYMRLQSNGLRELNVRMKPIPRTWSVTDPTADGLCGRQRTGMHEKQGPKLKKFKRRRYDIIWAGRGEWIRRLGCLIETHPQSETPDFKGRLESVDIGDQFKSTRGRRATTVI